MQEKYIQDRLIFSPEDEKQLQVQETEYLSRKKESRRNNIILYKLLYMTL